MVQDLLTACSIISAPAAVQDVQHISSKENAPSPLPCAPIPWRPYQWLPQPCTPASCAAHHPAGCLVPPASPPACLAQEPASQPASQLPPLDLPLSPPFQATSLSGWRCCQRALQYTQGCLCTRCAGAAGACASACSAACAGLLHCPHCNVLLCSGTRL